MIPVKPASMVELRRRENIVTAPIQAGDWNYPTSIKFGVGRVAELPDLIRELGIRNVLLVTDSGLVDQPWLRLIQEQLQQNKIAAEIFSSFAGNPDVTAVDAGVESFHQAESQAVVAIGGGSALDVGKALALVANQGRSVTDFEDVGDNWKRADVSKIVPCIAIPTTSGTGSEVGRASVLVDHSDQTAGVQGQVKKIIFHPQMIPDLVIADPALTVGLPAHLTAATGMDALSHNMEAWFSPSFHPMADGIALRGMRLVAQHLQPAVFDGDNLTARSAMMVASMCGATAFQKGLGAMHALAHPLGATTGAHHGLLNAVLMPYVLQANEPAIEAAAVELAEQLGLSGGFQSLLDWVLHIRRGVDIPHSLAEIGLTDIDTQAIGAAAVADAAAGGNPRSFSAAQYQAICEAALAGDLAAATIQ